MSNPNPQNIAFAAYEAPRLRVSMSPAEDITGWTMILNIRREGVLLYQTTAAVVEDAARGIFHFDLSSTTTGVTVGVGDCDYDVWRTNAGFERRLAWGKDEVQEEQWQ